MKKFLSLLIGAAVLFACNNEEKKTADVPKNTDLIGQNLKGRVQTFKVSSSIIDSTGASKPDSASYINEFDEKGYQTSYVTKDISGKIKEAQTLTHYEGGQVNEIIYKNGEGKQTSKWQITIDSSGKYNGAKIYDSAGKVSSIWKELKENEYGQVISGSEYKEDGSPKHSFANNYDKANYVGGWSKDSAGKETFRSAITLNDKGDAAEETTTTTKDSAKTEKFTYKYDSYDDKGNWTQMTTYNEKGKPIKLTKRVFTYYKD
jgi:hypothetical protein